MEKSNRRVQYLAAFSVSLASATMGCYASWTAPVIPKFDNNETDIDINKDQMSWIVSMSAPGFVTGSFVMRFVSDSFGRRTCLLASALPALVGTITIVLAKQAGWIYLAKFILGTSVGMVNNGAGLYFAEVSDKEIRGTLSLVTRFMFNFGNLLMMTIGPFVSYTTLNYMLLTLPVTYFLACWWIPESPYYYLKEGKVEAARRVLTTLRGYKDAKMLENELLQMKSQVRNEMSRSSTVGELLTGKRYRKAVFAATGLKFAQIVSGQLLIQQYLGLIIKESQFDMKLSTAMIIFGVVRFVVGVMSSVIADRVGRRPLLIGSFFGTGISLIVVGLYFFLMEVTRIDAEALKPYGFVTFAGLILSNIISTLGYNSLMVVVPAEIFPMNVKAIALMSLSIFAGSLNFFVSRGYQVVKDLTGLNGVFWIFGAACIGGAIFTILLVPETKGKSLREIQIQLQGSLYEDDEASKELNEVDAHDDLKEVLKGKEHKELCH